MSDPQDDGGRIHQGDGGRTFQGDGGRTLQGDGARRAATTGPESVDPHGRAALLLVESLIHLLVDKGHLTRSDAIDVIETASDVEIEFALAEQEPGSPVGDSLLAPLTASFDR